MATTFPFYFQLGFHHIIDWAALDHLLFLLALCAGYAWTDWRRVLLLITAFTVGHCLTLLVAGLDLVRVPAAAVELLIPLTIVATAVYNLWPRQAAQPGPARRGQGWALYTTALCFGLIHGLGFSNTFRALLFPDEQDLLLQQLLAFNIGIEAGQVLVVGGILLLAYLAQTYLQLTARTWTLLLSVAALVPALVMVAERSGF